MSEDNRELAEKLMDAKDMEQEMSNVKDDWLEEIHNENLATVEQLQSDLEDAKDEIIRLLEENIALRKQILGVD
jgi:hypothetical protein